MVQVRTEKVGGGVSADSRTGGAEIPAGPPLTARGVKARLTRAGADYRHLDITDGAEVSRLVDVDRTGPWRRQTVVTITGSREARREADDVLFWAGLSCAPYPDRSIWRR
ncbi:hypothetical protein GCM10027403_14620 [Arthrobacter tecti]